MQDFRQLKVWQKAHAFTLSLYKVTQNFPRSETYGLRSQLRRAAASVPTNIVEGACRQTDRSTRAYLDIARGSAGEVEYLLILCTELEMLSPGILADLLPRLHEVQRMLATFIKRLGPGRTR